MDKQEKTGGKRVQKSGGGSKALAVCACAAAVLAAAYALLCGWATGRVLPNSTAAGVELGGLSRAQAQERMERAAEDWQDKSVELTFHGKSVTCELGKAEPAFDADAVLDQLSVGEKPFPARGAAWIGALLGGESHTAESPLVFTDQLYIDGLLTELNSTLSQPMVEHTVKTEDDHILFTRGQTGMAIDTVTVEETLLERIAAGDYSGLELEAAVTEPEKPDFQELQRQVYVEPRDAALDPKTFTITPSVTGVSLDPAAAQALFERAQPGESFAIPLKRTEPEITTEKLEASLFADKLGEATSNVGGSSNRLSNVKLAGELCNETILLPGDEFSYWSKIAPCTVEQGFKPAPTYLDGKTVNGIGGGVCQMSSSIYTAALAANLEIVQRNQHTFAVGYLPDGSDAMVSSGSSDFKFRNSTDYPIKIVVILENRKLTVQLWGTKTDETYVKMEFRELSSDPYETVYEIDDSVPAGTVKEKANGYRGRRVEAYRCVYAGDGTLLSRTLESKNNYRRRDRILLINSADAAKYGLDASGQPLPETPAPSESPAPSEPPVTSDTPAPSEPPVVSEPPAPSETPGVSQPPEASETPGTAEIPVVPEASPAPEDTPEPPPPPVE